MGIAVVAYVAVGIARVVVVSVAWGWMFDAFGVAVEDEIDLSPFDFSTVEGGFAGFLHFLLLRSSMP